MALQPVLPSPRQPLEAAGLLSLVDVAEAYAWRAEDDAPRREKYQRLWNAFSSAHPVRDAFFCRQDATGACVHLENDDQLLLILPVHSTIPDWITERLLDCRNLQTEIRQVLGPPNSRVCTEMLFGLIVQLLRQADAHVKACKSETGPATKLAADAGQLVYEQQLVSARSFYVRAALRVAQNRYFAGMLLGVLFLVLAVVAMLGLQMTAFRWTLIEDDVQILVASLLVGGLGAMVSVMQRLTKGQLQLPYRASKTEMVLYGFFRPLIGAVFGTLLFVVLRAGLISVAGAPPAVDAQRLLYFYVALAFFAGFSERWAQDVLSASGVKLEGPEGGSHSGRV
jgi:hypothetical protein